MDAFIAKSIAGKYFCPERESRSAVSEVLSEAQLEICCAQVQIGAGSTEAQAFDSRSPEHNLQQ